MSNSESPTEKVKKVIEKRVEESKIWVIRSIYVHGYNTEKQITLDVLTYNSPGSPEDALGSISIKEQKYTDSNEVGMIFVCQSDKNVIPIHGTRVGFNLGNKEIVYLGVISRSVLDRRAERKLPGGKKGVLRIYRTETVDASRASRVK